MFRSCPANFVIYCIGHHDFFYIYCWQQFREGVVKAEQQKEAFDLVRKSKCAFQNTQSRELVWDILPGSVTVAILLHNNDVHTEGLSGCVTDQPSPAAKGIT